MIAPDGYLRSVAERFGMSGQVESIGILRCAQDDNFCVKNVKKWRV
jgi:hypothetical protein